MRRTGIPHDGGTMRRGPHAGRARWSGVGALVLVALPTVIAGCRSNSPGASHAHRAVTGESTTHHHATAASSAAKMSAEGARFIRPARASLGTACVVSPAQMSQLVGTRLTHTQHWGMSVSPTLLREVAAKEPQQLKAARELSKNEMRWCVYDNLNQTSEPGPQLDSAPFVTVGRFNSASPPKVTHNPENIPVPEAGQGGFLIPSTEGVDGQCKPASGNGWLSITGQRFPTTSADDTASGERTLTAICNAG